MEATGALSASVSYADHTDDVTVRLNGLADDGTVGEGDNVLGQVTVSPAAPVTIFSRPAPPRVAV